MPTDKEIRLLVQAQLQTKSTFAELSQQLADLTAKLTQQASAANIDSAAVSGLRDKIKETFAQIQGQNSDFNQFKGLTVAVEKSALSAQKAGASFVELRLKLANLDAPTEKQATRLATLEAKAKLAVDRYTALNAKLVESGAAFRAAGVAVDNFALQEERVSAMAVQTGRAIATADTALTAHQAKLRETAEVQRKADEAARAPEVVERQETDDQLARAAAAKRVAEARQIAEDAALVQRRAAQDYVAFWTRALDEVEGREKEAAAQFAESTRIASAGQSANEAARKAASSFQIAGQNAAMQARGYSVLDSSTRIAPSTSSASDTIQKIVNPAEQARQTIAGLEEQIGGLGTIISALNGPVAGYDTLLQNLARTQNALAKQAGLVDAFKDQLDVVRAARAQYASARSEVIALGQAQASAAAPTEDMARATKDAERALDQASKTLARELVEARELRSGLQATGIATNDLATAQARLETGASSTVASFGRLNNAYEKFGKASGGGQGLFGLKPYELQDLGYQINDVFTSLSSGISVMQTIAQQSGQIIQIFPKAENAVVQVFGFLIKRIPEVAIALAVLGTAYAVFGQSIADTSAQREFQARLNATTDSANYTAKAMVEASRSIQNLGVSFADAKVAVQDLAEAGLNPQRFQEFGKVAEGLVQIWGVKMPEATKATIAAFTGSYADLEAYNDQYHVLTATVMENIRVLFQQGESEKAHQVALDATAQKVGDAAAKARGPWGEAFHGLSETWRTFLDIVGNSLPFEIAEKAIDKLGKGVAAFFALDRNLIAFLGRGVGIDVSSKTPQQELSAAQQRVQDTSAALDVAKKSPSATSNATANPFYSSRIPGVAKTGDVAEAQKQYDAARMALDKLTEAQKKNGESNNSVSLTTDQKTASADNYLKKLRATVLEEQKGSGAYDAQQRIDNARFKASEAFLSNPKTRGDQTGANQAADIAEGRERALIAKDNYKVVSDQAKEAAQDGKNSSDVLAAGQKSYNAAVAAGVKDQEALNSARQDGQETERTILSKAAEAATKAATAAKEKAAAERTLQQELSTLAAEATRKDVSDVDAKLKTITDKYAAFYQKLAEAQKDHNVTSVNGQSIGSLVEQAQAAEATAKLQAQLDGYKAEQKKSLETTSNDLANGAITPATAIQQITDAATRLRAQLQGAAKDAFTLSKTLSPADATRLRNRAISEADVDANGNQVASPGTDKETRRAITQTVGAASKTVDEGFATRSNEAKEYNDLVAQGAISTQKAQAEIKASYEETGPAILQAIDELQKANDAAKAAGTVTTTQYDLVNAKIAQMRQQVVYIDPLLAQLRTSLKEGFSHGLDTGIDSISKSLGDLIAKTGTWNDVLKSARNSVLDLVASLLKAAATPFINQQTSNAGSGIASLFSSLFGSAAGAAGGGSLDASAAISAAAAFHTGGIVGAAVQMTRTNLSPHLFDNAPRYHSGGTIGLAPNEQAAVLQKGEEVLTSSDPRNALNGGRNAGGAAGAPVSYRHVLLQDPADIPAAMASSGGETVTLTHIKRNAASIRQLLNMRGGGG